MPSKQKNPKDQSIESLCNRCGKDFSAFLHQMEVQNEKVVCPHCGEQRDRTPPKKAARPEQKQKQ
jgi:DNA-directed RNA polymerase subunit RPC12/RpoP